MAKKPEKKKKAAEISDPEKIIIENAEDGFIAYIFKDQKRISKIINTPKDLVKMIKDFFDDAE